MDRKDFDEYFKEANYELNYNDPIGVRKFKTIDSMLTDMTVNEEFWKECKHGMSATIHSKFMNLKTQLENVVKKIELDSSTWNSLYPELKRAISSFNATNGSSTAAAISANTDVAHKVRKLCQENYKYANGFLKFYNHYQLNMSDRDEMFGVFEAYNYLYSDVKTEKAKMYENSLSVLTSNYTNEVDEIEDRYTINTRKVEEHYQSLKKTNNEWQDQKTLEVDSLIREKNERLQYLENLYEEKLRLQSPAKYWSELESNFKKEGTKWLIFAISITVIAILSLGKILYNLPSSLNVSIENAGFNTIRAILILTVMVSLAVYLIRLMVRLAMSSYHLSRDAKERHQLSYFYLALLKDEGIKNEDRMIVLQALFSRSDTGLIKGDSSPSFPIDSMLAQVAKNFMN